MSANPASPDNNVRSQLSATLQLHLPAIELGNSFAKAEFYRPRCTVMTNGRIHRGRPVTQYPVAAIDDLNTKTGPATKAPQYFAQSFHTFNTSTDDHHPHRSRSAGQLL